jgi:hypothetical protein
MDWCVLCIQCVFPVQGGMWTGYDLSLGDCSPLSTGALYGRLQRVTIPDAVTTQFGLLRMSIVLLETCRGL